MLCQLSGNIFIPAISSICFTCNHRLELTSNKHIDWHLHGLIWPFHFFYNNQDTAIFSSNSSHQPFGMLLKHNFLLESLFNWIHCWSNSPSFKKGGWWQLECWYPCHSCCLVSLRRITTQLPMLKLTLQSNFLVWISVYPCELLATMPIVLDLISLSLLQSVKFKSSQTFHASSYVVLRSGLCIHRLGAGTDSFSSHWQ